MTWETRTIENCHWKHKLDLGERESHKCLLYMRTESCMCSHWEEWLGEWKERSTLPFLMHSGQRRAYSERWRVPWFCQSVRSSSFQIEEKLSPSLYITDGCWNCTGQQAVPKKTTTKTHTQKKHQSFFFQQWNLVRRPSMQTLRTLLRFSSKGKTIIHSSHLLKQEFSMRSDRKASVQNKEYSICRAN